MSLRKLVSALVLGTALIVPSLLPTDASAQGRGRHEDDRHDQGRHNGGDRQRKHDDDRRRDDWKRRNDSRQRADEARRREERLRYERSRVSRDEAARRQNSKNQWRNLGYLGGAAGVYGLLTGNKTVAALGLGGGLYSAYRYEQDRKSQSNDSRGRYELFRRDSFDHNGHHYVRRTKNQGGQKYFYFQRTR